MKRGTDIFSLEVVLSMDNVQLLFRSVCAEWGMQSEECHDGADVAHAELTSGDIWKGEHFRISGKGARTCFF